MTPRKLTIGFASFPYGGNGGVASEYPAIRYWMLRTLPKLMYQDERIEKVIDPERLDIADTPLTASRNLCIERAQQLGVDVLVIVDSDMKPDAHVKEAGAKPFFESSFDYLYERWEQGPQCIFAPYCGPSPSHNVYVFAWTNNTQSHGDDNFQLEAYGRREAAAMAGIQEAGAGPTGLMMLDMRLFKEYPQPYFYYEWEGDDTHCPSCRQPVMERLQEPKPDGTWYRPGPRSQKVSTEDVTFTRDLSQWWIRRYGYNPLKCNWDAWAAHIKVEEVGKPIIFRSDQVNAKIVDAADANLRSEESLVMIGDDAPGFDRRMAEVTVMPSGNGK